MATSKEFPQYRWVTPRSFTQGRKTGQPSVIVIHTTEGSEGVKSAEDGAAYDARRTDGTSTHFFCDQDSTVQCVLTTDEAHTARAHGNDVGVQIEICGRAGQTKNQWDDKASTGALEQAARLCKTLRDKWGDGRFPLKHLTPTQLHAGGPGFAGHVDVTRAWPEDKGTHTDPGTNFPWAAFLNRIKALEQAAMRALVWQSVSGTSLPVLKKGENDADGYANSSTFWVTRAQRQLRIVDDGDYGPATAAAINALGLPGHNGTTIDMPVWEKLFGLWGASSALGEK